MKLLILLIIFVVFISSDGQGLHLVPWVQVFERNWKDHFYTINEQYAKELSNHIHQGFAALMANDTTDCSDKVWVRGYWDETDKNHYYTTNPAEIGQQPEPTYILPKAYCVKEEGQCGATLPIQRYQRYQRPVVEQKELYDDYYVAGKVFETDAYKRQDIQGYDWKETLCYAWPVQGKPNCQTFEPTCDKYNILYKYDENMKTQVQIIYSQNITTTGGTVEYPEGTLVITMTAFNKVVICPNHHCQDGKWMKEDLVLNFDQRVPLYQLYEPNRRDHYYTTDWHYAKSLTYYGTHIYHGIAFAVITEFSPCKEKILLREFWDPVGENHFYTTEGTGGNTKLYCAKIEHGCSNAHLAINRYQYIGAGTKKDDYYVAGNQLEIPGYKFKEVVCYGWNLLEVDETCYDHCLHQKSCDALHLVDYPSAEVTYSFTTMENSVAIAKYNGTTVAYKQCHNGTWRDESIILG